MTNEEAIRIISNYEALPCGYCHQGGKEIEEAFNIAIEALKEKGFMKPIERTAHAQGADEVWYECRKCGGFLDANFPKNGTVCKKCGSIVKWGE